MIDLLLISRLRSRAFERLAVEGRGLLIWFLAGNHVVSLVLLLHRLVMLGVGWGSETTCTSLLRRHCRHIR